MRILLILLLTVTSAYCLNSLNTKDQVFGAVLVEDLSHNYIAEKPSKLDTIHLASLDTSEITAEGTPAAELSSGSELSISSLVYLCIDLGYLLVFTLLTAGVVKFLGVYGYCISKGKGGK